MRPLASAFLEDAPLNEVALDAEDRRVAPGRLAQPGKLRPDAEQFPYKSRHVHADFEEKLALRRTPQGRSLVPFIACEQIRIGRVKKVVERARQIGEPRRVVEVRVAEPGDAQLRLG